jgi:predicted RNase H-like nuclease
VGVRGAVVDEPRTTTQGVTARQWVLDKVDDRATDVLERAHRTHVEPDPRARRLTEDDAISLVDGLALALAAREGDLQTLPDDPPTDDRGLTMQSAFSPVVPAAEREGRASDVGLHRN